MILFVTYPTMDLGANPPVDLGAKLDITNFCLKYS
jgi:hypothetical protein